MSSPVRVWTETVIIPTYLPHRPDPNPMFLEKRVYQGSSGRVYPLPFTDRIAEGKVDRPWRAVWLENEYLRAMVLPELGGRVHVLQDKTNGYDLIYRQAVIKPALVGLAGSWISGGIEFNWPQHHRPATFLPVDHQVEEHADGSVTVWCSDHDPLERMKGMHGVCLHPGRAVLEVKVRAYNRTPVTRTFLWWANVATRVHEGYQSFFPPDVTHVADHAKRATSTFPLCDGVYYGINYGRRSTEGVPAAECPPRFVPPHCRPGQADPRTPRYAPNDLSWYANIPTPCSYMAMGSTKDFFGGYDHHQRAGLVHFADHRIAPGKKQWTWGNHEFGYAWDRHLSDDGDPYIELMAGVFTDNQPDFTFLQPGETKAWSQYWYPLREIGPPSHANLEAAVTLEITRDRVRLGVNATAAISGARIRLEQGTRRREWRADVSPSQPWTAEIPQPARKWPVHGCTLRVVDARGAELIAFSPTRPKASVAPPPATEPPPPDSIASADELYFTGLHLEQYRHATRCPTLYWREALRRDSGDARVNTAMGRWHLRRGEFDQAARHLENAIARLTRRNPNPEDGGSHYLLGLCRRYQMDLLPPGSEEHAELEAQSRTALGKAIWNEAWLPAARHALAELDCRIGHWADALTGLEEVLRKQSDNLRARALQVMVLRRLGREEDAIRLLNATQCLDPLDAWSGLLAGRRVTKDAQVWLDVAHDLARAGFFEEAVECLRPSADLSTPGDERFSLPTQSWGAAPLVLYTLGWLEERRGRAAAARNWRRQAMRVSPDYCFPARLEEIAVLTSAIARNARDPRAPYYLGNLLYDRRRHSEAIAHWEQSTRLDPEYAVSWRNLGLAYFNVMRRPARARAAYERAAELASDDARIHFERDQLWKRMGVDPARRLAEMQKHLQLVTSRDDFSVELAALYNQTGQPAAAKALLASRHFQPWEGGEGQTLAQHRRAHLLLGNRALAVGEPARALECFQNALAAPANLGEANHLLTNLNDIHLALGEACHALGRQAAARRHWTTAASAQDPGRSGETTQYSEITYHAALAWRRLGREQKAVRLLRSLLDHARSLGEAPAKIDYFATSLPALLLFDDDLQARQRTTAQLLEAQARLGLGQRARATALLEKVLAADPHNPFAADLSRQLRR